MTIAQFDYAEQTPAVSYILYLLTVVDGAVSAWVRCESLAEQAVTPLCVLTLDLPLLLPLFDVLIAASFQLLHAGQYQHFK